MLIELTDRRHNTMPLAVNPDHIMYVEPVKNEDGERANVYLTNGHILQVRETVQQVVELVNSTLTIDLVEAVEGAVSTIDNAVVEAAVERAARQDKPGSKRETK